MMRRFLALLGLAAALVCGPAAQSTAILATPAYGGIATTATVVIVPFGSTYVIPSNYQSSVNGAAGYASKIEVVGQGSCGNLSNTGGGGGGAYAAITNAALTPGATVGLGHNSSGCANDEWFCNSTSNCASLAGTAVIVGAEHGHSAVTSTGGSGGLAANSIGTTKFNGGNGATSSGNGGGGGAAGMHGAGNNGSGTSGGSGDAGFGGAGGSAGSAGGNGTEWDASHGSGGGGGSGADGGLRGGGSGSFAPAPNALGVIVLTYYAAL